MSDDVSNIPMERAGRFGTPEGGYEVSQCQFCAHYQGDRRCAAFGSTEIPIEILENSFDHRQNHPGDNGLAYEPEGDEAEHPWETWSGAHGDAQGYGPRTTVSGALLSAISVEDMTT